jgi:hypothetical protein
VQSKNDNFIHQQLPVCFKDIKLQDFASFAQERVVDSSLGINFHDWVELLAYLHASPKFTVKVRELALTCTSPLSVVTAWSTLGIVCEDNDVLTTIPLLDENVDFFVAHKYSAVITKQRDPNVKLYIPEEVIEMLNPAYMMLSTSKVVATQHVPADFHALECLKTYANIGEIIHRVCEALLRHNYIIVRNAKWLLVGIAPEGYDNVILRWFLI